MINDIRRLKSHPQLSIRLLDKSDIPQVTALRDEVLEQLIHPDHYVREDNVEEFVLHNIGFHSASRGHTIGIFEGQQLVAYAMLGFPTSQDSDNLGWHLTTDLTMLGNVAHIAGCMVRAKWRRKGLQRLLLIERFELARSMRRPTCIAMVSLLNDTSRRNLMSSGMRIGWVGTLNGLKRQLLVLNLEQPWEFDHESIKLIDCLDLHEQTFMCTQGWWGVGEFLDSSGQVKIVFARRITHGHSDSVLQHK